MFMSEDAFQGDAQFRVSLDGQVLGGVCTVTASHAAGQSEAFTFTGDFGPGPHNISIQFLNALPGPSPETRRFLYLDSIQFGSTNYTTPAVFDHDETLGFTFRGPGATNVTQTDGNPGPDTLVLTLSEDTNNGNALFVVSVDGVQVGGTQRVDALAAANQTETFTFTGNFGTGPQQIALTYINQNGGASGDRLLYLNSLEYDGQTFQNSSTSLSEWDTSLITLNGSTCSIGAEQNYTPPEVATGGSFPTIVETPTVPTPQQLGDVVGFQLQNNGTTAIAAREITFGETFTDGSVPAGSILIATIDGQQVAVQMDVKTYNPDGSVGMAVLTLEQPPIAAGATLNGMLSLAPAGSSPGNPLNIAALTTSGAYSFVVDLLIHNADGSTTNDQFDAASLLAQALQNGTASYWLQGPQATQVRIDTPVAGSMHLTFDICLYADGNVSTDLGFNNDYAMQASGGTVSYGATVTQNGLTVFDETNITQYQYQNWNQTFWTDGAPTVNVVHDPNELEQAGAVQNYDTSTGVDGSALQTEATNLATGTTFGVLGSADVTTYMPETGGRADIGPMTLWDELWLLTGNQTAATYALAQANVAGSVPWNFADPTAGSGNYITVTEYPWLWDDPRGGTPEGWGTTGLTQPVSTLTGWTPDTAHQPDLSYFDYLMTGNRVYLDDLNSQAAYDELTTWPGPRDGGQGLFLENDQVRSEAWSMREVIEAADANPVGSPMKAYFTQMAANNIQALLSFAQNSGEGQVAGWVPGSAYSGAEEAPWEEDFLATTVAEAAEMGIPGAKQVLAWETNFLAGRFLNGANGFNPFDGANYQLALANPDGTPFTTWAQVGAADQAAGLSGDGTWSMTDSYVPGAEASLADCITVLGSTEAIQAYGWLLANAGDQANLALEQAAPTFSIVPRLDDGNLLTSNHVIISNDAATATVSGSNADQLIYETGPGAVTIQGGSGINILFAGSGSDILVGGPGQDYLFGGIGSDTFEAGAGTNFMQAGSGADLLVLNPTDVASDLIAGFKLGVDHLEVYGAPPGSGASQAYLAGATSDASGDAVLHLSAGHNVTLQGITVAQLGSFLFA